ncbi:zinc ABC transporter ATP-binding protein AztA [Nocardia crassostreae]|uniref:zinc ABC transporter ATP-binding protein AztA n=1 Tax=Nocardia crassostreae TaxID=53428 RepID=UPI00083186B4|nr:zinc ABC transporter ATP-binding protein AztA [Nocardia crassostreae]
MHSPADPALRIHRVCAAYGGTAVLHEVTAEIPRGRVTAVAGPNGSGKSTLLGVLAGVITPTAGTIEHAGVRRPALAVQQASVPPTLPITVRETVAMGRWAERGPWRRLTRADKAIVDACLERMAIADLAHRPLTALSGGQRQRALLAQALAQESDLLLLDEPATGLDSDSEEEIAAALRAAAADGVTVVHATHDREAALRAHHRLSLRAGRLTEPDEPAADTRVR